MNGDDKKGAGGSEPAAVRSVRVKRWWSPVTAEGMHLLDSGQCRVAINFGKKYVFKANEAGFFHSVEFLRDGLIFLPPGRTPLLTVPDHRRTPQPKGELTQPFLDILPLHMDLSLLEEAAALAGLSPSVARGLPNLSLALDAVGCLLAKSLDTAFKNSADCSVAQVESIALSLALWIVEHRADDSHVNTGMRPVQSAINRALRRIETDFDLNLTLQILADEASMSRFHFARSFKQITGLSPHQYLIQTRIDNAKRLLIECVEAGRSIAMQDIAFDMGFSSHSQFSAAFARANGASPSAWLRALTQERHGTN